MDGAGQEPVLFENAAWRVTEAGLEHKGNGYFIERAQLGERRCDGLWAWPMHLAEKAWCDAELFAEAFLEALRHSGVTADGDLAISLVALGREDGERDKGPSRKRTGRSEDVPSLGDLVMVEVEAIGEAAQRKLKQSERAPVEVDVAIFEIGRAVRELLAAARDPAARPYLAAHRKRVMSDLDALSAGLMTLDREAA